MIDGQAVKRAAAELLAADPATGECTALKLATVRAILDDGDTDLDRALRQIDLVFEACGWEINHVIAKLSGAL